MAKNPDQLSRKMGRFVALGMQYKLYGIVCALFLLGMFKGASAGVVRVDPSLTTEKINLILNGVRGGDTVLFAGGTYRGPFRLDGISGAANRPVVLRGSGKRESVIDGKAAPGMYQQQYAFLLTGCSWITIENMEIRNCWTDLVRAENSSYVTLRNCGLTGGKRALFATGRESHHFLVEHCHWEQEPRVWSHEDDFSWDEIHHGIHQHYNGSLFQGSGISGVFVLRDNVVKNTFNAFRLSQINDGEMDLLACTNGEIYRNYVYNTSDNVLEPEVHALNLHYYHNHMVNGHAFVSITEVAGGEIYIYGNTAVSLPESEDGWTIFKISSRQQSLTRPLYIFNNSWQVDFDIIGSPRNIWQNDYLRHFNNAMVSEASDTFGIYNLGKDNRFDYDCSNVPFPALLTSRGMERNGLVADPLFTDPYGGDFRLKEGSPCIDAGTFEQGLIRSFEGIAPDIGAYDNGHLIEGPPFRYMEPAAEVPYREMPRITRHWFDGEDLELWFSIPLKEESLDRIRFRVRTGSEESEWQIEGLSEDGYGLWLTRSGSGSPRIEPGGDQAALYTNVSDGAVTGGTVPGEAGPAASGETAVLLLSGWPEGINGMTMTSWASTLPVRLMK